MITVSFKTNDKTGSITLEMTGHARFAEPGKDLVCAWASGLGYTAAQEVAKYAQQDDLRKKPTVILEKGHLKVSCIPKPERYVEVLKSFYVVQTGFEVLSDSSPLHVNLESFASNLTPAQRKQLARIK